MFCDTKTVAFLAGNDPSQPLIVLGENLYTEITGWLFPSNSIVYFPFNEAIVGLFEGGFVEFWLSKYEQLQKRLNVHPDDEPQVFSMSHLSIGFIIWLSCLAISFTAFLLEALVGFCREEIEKSFII